ncbi:MAG: DUF4131 domain-containing protein, partial [Planctomycetes bacterium]|nr:DUF4131 domain-containing protein [Planctomycetota bacterium]
MDRAPSRFSPTRRPVLAFAMATLAGGLLGGVEDSLWFLAWLGLLFSLCLVSFEYGRPRQWLGLALRVALIGLCFGFSWWYAEAEQSQGPDDILLRFPSGTKNITLEGIVVEGTPSVAALVNPDPDDKVPELFRGRELASRSFLMAIDSDGDGQASSGQVRVFVSGAQDYRAGNRVRVNGSLSPARK